MLQTYSHAQETSLQSSIVVTCGSQWQCSQGRGWAEEMSCWCASGMCRETPNSAGSQALSPRPHAGAW